MIQLPTIAEAQSSLPGPLPAKKIWEIRSCYKCALIGACLTCAELRRLARSREFSLDQGYDDYQLHAEFIRISDQADGKGKALQKYLAKKYNGQATKYRQAQTDEAIKGLWDEDLAQGRLDIAWWAVLTHPLASVELIGNLYGQLHMLGHDSLNSHHRERTQLVRLRAKVAMLEEVLGSERRYHRQERKQWQGMFNDLEHRLHDHEAAEQASRGLRDEVVGLRGRLLSMETNQDKAHHKQAMDELRQHNSMLCGQINELTADLSALQEQFTLLDGQRRRLEQQKLEQGREIAALEDLLGKHLPRELPCSHCTDQHTSNCPGLNLCGKTVLYVGGLNNLIPFYRRLIEQCGGRFLHHDGGIEASRSQLPRMLTSADAVLCPVDCVSHDACHCVKKMCKRYQKPFVLMRSAGLSSLARSLEDIVQ